MKNFTVKLLLCLCLILVRSNAYAWYCSYTPSPEGWVTNLQCYGISNSEALAIAWCPYRPQDPICGTPEPVCTTRTESQSLACPVHYSGAINQSRSNTCPSEDMGAWVTTSDNCTPDPPTCQTSIEERQVACQDGYSGSITEQRSSSCPDPYGQPIFGVWGEIQNSCVKSVTNPTNVNSPVSPVSPINPMAAPAPPVPEAQPVMNTDSPAGIAEAPPPIAAPKPEVSSSATTSSSPTATKTETKTETKVETKTESKQETPQKVDVPKGKELVGGFGLVMSLEILNNPITFQQQQLEIALEYTQELPYELRGQQGFLHGLLMEGSSDNFYSIVNGRWNALRSSIEVQPDF